MTEKKLAPFFRRLTAAVMIPLVAASAYLLKTVLDMIYSPQYPIFEYIDVGDCIETILGALVTYLAAYFVLMIYLYRFLNYKGNNRKK